MWRKPRISRTRQDYWLLCQALAGICLARLGLLFFRLPAVRRTARLVLRAERRLPAEGCCSPEQVIRATVSAAIHSPVGSTCLATALVAQAMLQRHGYEATLRVGVRHNPDGAFAAHAWLEREGKVVVGGPLPEVETYTAMPEMEHLIR